MILLITKDKNIELPENTEMYQDTNNKWWWKKFFSIDGVGVENPNLSKYSMIYEDFKKPVKLEFVQASLF